jgi:hypothetical protein
VSEQQGTGTPATATEGGTVDADRAVEQAEGKQPTSQEPAQPAAGDPAVAGAEAEETPVPRPSPLELGRHHRSGAAAEPGSDVEAAATPPLAEAGPLAAAHAAHPVPGADTPPPGPSPDGRGSSADGATTEVEPADEATGPPATSEPDTTPGSPVTGAPDAAPPSNGNAAPAPPAVRGADPASAPPAAAAPDVAPDHHESPVPPTTATTPVPGPPRPGPPAVPAPPRPGPPAVPAPPRPGPAAVPAAPHPAPATPPAATSDVPVPVPVPVAQPSPVPSASTHPDRWGRVDAEGTIYVRTPDGERVVGNWQAGAPEEGLAHFARRFDDLLTEVELLAARLAAGGGEPKHALHSAKTLRDGLDEATVVGDLVGLRARLDDLVAQSEEAVAAARSARDAQRAAAVARKEELAAEAEVLAAEATQWKQAGDRFKAILDEWRAIRGIDRKTDELLWKRFSKAREAFNRRRGSHFADLDRQRATAKTRKEELVVEAEKLTDSDDWGPTAARFRDLMTEWKAAGRAQKDADDSLWHRFRIAQDAFFARRSGTFAERDAEFASNAEAKRALLVEAEKIDPSDPAGARAALRHIQERWEEIGKVPRDDIRSLEAGLRAVEEKVREAADRQWRRTDPEAEARVAQFRERVAQFEAQAEKARAAGDARRAQQAQSQADQWREWLTTAEQAVQQL